MQWEDRMWKGLFKYDVTASEVKVFNIVPTIPITISMFVKHRIFAMLWSHAFLETKSCHNLGKVETYKIVSDI